MFNKFLGFQNIIDEEKPIPNLIDNYLESFSQDFSEEFIFSDADFSDFSSYISDKEYTYKTETEKSLETLKKKAEEEDYFDNLSAEYDILFAKMLENKNNDLQKSKEDIKEILTGEIMSRYFYQKGRIKAGLNFDIEVEKAILENKTSFGEAVNKFSDDESSKFSGGAVTGRDGSTYINFDQLDKEMVVLIQNMKPGDISEPQVYVDDRGRKTVRIIYYKERKYNF